jgi:hypothetical protein
MNIKNFTGLAELNFDGGLKSFQDVISFYLNAAPRVISSGKTATKFHLHYEHKNKDQLKSRLFHQQKLPYHPHQLFY